MCESSIIINQPIKQTTVIIDTDVNTIYPVANFIKQLSSNFEKFLNVSNNVISNSSAYLNLDQEVKLNVLEGLSSKWIETAQEMDTLQDNLSSNWESTYLEVSSHSSHVIDGGLF